MPKARTLHEDEKLRANRHDASPLPTASACYRTLAVASLLALSGGCSSDHSPPSDGTGNGGASGGTAGAGNGGGQLATGGTTAGNGSAGTDNAGGQPHGGANAGGTGNGAGQSGTAGGAGEMPIAGAAGHAGSIAAGGSASGAGGAGGATAVLAILTDTNRDGAVDERDSAGFTDWTWSGEGAFFIANTDDDDENGETDASDAIVNGVEDEKDLARILVRVPPGESGLSVSVSVGRDQTRLFQKTGDDWALVSGSISEVAPEVELGIEANQFADSTWDGLVTVKVELAAPGASGITSQEVRLRVAPWILLPQSAKTELLYISSSTTNLRPDLDAVLEGAGLPAAVASSPGAQDIWFQDTMEIGYTQLPGREPMHVVMRAQRPNASDDVALTLLAPDFGFISVGTPRQPGNEEDHWMDWMGNLEVTHPVPDYPLGRIYYGRSDRTTFHPTIVEFLEAQEVQEPFTVYTNWLLIQHVDEIMNFLSDESDRAKLIIVSPEAASTVMGSDLDAVNRQIQSYVDDEIAQAKTELGLTDEDIIQLPTLFEQLGETDYVPIWSNPVNSVLADRTFMIGDTNTPEPIKADIEQKLDAIGIRVAWVDDSEYHAGGGNVHCGTNTKKTPLCENFTMCLP